MIRKAEISDIPALEKLLLQVQNVHAVARPDIFKIGGVKYDESALKALLSDETRPIFVYEDTSVDGYVFCVLTETKENTSLKKRKTLYIDDLCVDEEKRKRGIGKSLFEYAVNFAKVSGCDSVTLNVWHSNENAVAFYNSLGLKPLKTTMEQIL